MAKDQFPDSKEEIIDLLAKTKQLKVENELGSVTLESHDSINIQPSNTPFGAKLKVADGNSSAALTFDSKKMKPTKKEIDFDQLIDDAILKYNDALQQLSDTD